MSDDTELLRRAQQKVANSEPGDRYLLEEKYGQVWNTEELANDFEVQGFLAPYVVVKRKSDNAVGSLMFKHYPRFYWGFELYEK